MWSNVERPERDAAVDVGFSLVIFRDIHLVWALISLILMVPAFLWSDSY